MTLEPYVTLADHLVMDHGVSVDEVPTDFMAVIDRHIQSHGLDALNHDHGPHGPQPFPKVGPGEVLHHRWQHEPARFQWMCTPGVDRSIVAVAGPTCNGCGVVVTKETYRDAHGGGQQPGLEVVHDRLDAVIFGDTSAVVQFPPGAA